MIRVILFLCYCVLTNQANANEQISSVTLSPHLTELVYSAGGAESLVGVSAYSNFPKESLNIQVIGDAFRVNHELLKTLDPDVIFYWKNGTANQVIQQLKNMDFQLHEINIDQLSDIPKAIIEIAEILGTTPTSSIKNFTQQLNGLKNNTLKKRSALIQISSQPIFTVNGQHWMSEAISVCGLHNIYSEIEPLSASVTLESVVINKPEVIITTGEFPQNPLTSWDSIPAIKKGQIIQLDADSFTRPTLRILNAINDLCSQLSQY